MITFYAIDGQLFAQTSAEAGECVLGIDPSGVARWHDARTGLQVHPSNGQALFFELAQAVISIPDPEPTLRQLTPEARAIIHAAFINAHMASPRTPYSEIHSLADEYVSRMEATP